MIVVKCIPVTAPACEMRSIVALAALNVNMSGLQLRPAWHAVKLVVTTVARVG